MQLPSPTSIAPPGRLAGRRLLVVEDDDDARELILFVLTSEDAVVEACPSAERALEAIDSFHPDLVVSDVGMPGHDGYWLVNRMRERWPGLGAIALSAFAQDADVARCKREGFLEHLSKPVEPDELVSAIAHRLDAA